MENERDPVWDRIALESLRRAWGKEDEIWDRIVTKIRRSGEENHQARFEK
ncbi:MAG: hypothetical protein Q7R47_06160 [Candidatus Diapherotrites archaeon]|nr:hypothetical protein [Candidatus Diapherotrites archaeon]